MELNAIEKTQNKLRIVVEGESHTLLNLLRETAWKNNAKQAAYSLKHPYISVPQIVVKATYPKKVLSDSAKMISEDAAKFRREFKKALK